MWLKPIYMFAFFGCCCLMASLPAAAQDGYPATEMMEQHKEKSQYMPSGDESGSLHKHEVEKDSVIMRPRMKAAEKNPEKQSSNQSEQESVLSFNFLYYIIQKFKMSDIVEQ